MAAGVTHPADHHIGPALVDGAGEPRAFGAAAHVVAALRADPHLGAGHRTDHRIRRDRPGAVQERADRRRQLVGVGTPGGPADRAGPGIAPVRDHLQLRSLAGGHCGEHTARLWRGIDEIWDGCEHFVGEHGLRPRQRHLHRDQHIGANGGACRIDVVPSREVRASHALSGFREQLQRVHDSGEVTNMPVLLPICDDDAVMDPELPTEPGAISADWLQRAVCGEGRGAVRAVSYEPVGTGLMGRSYRFRITGSGAVPASVVIKVPSADIATRQLGASAYRKEVGFYRDLAPSVTATIPHCHWADISEDGQSFVLVLEDIADATQGDQVAGCSVSEAERAIRNLARLHASTWGQASLAQRPWCLRTEGPGLAEYLPIALQAFEDRFSGRLENGTSRVFKAFVERAAEWAEVEPAVQAAVHGDYRLDNLLFATGDATVTAVDWQTVDYLNPGRDVAYFLGNSLETATRRSHEAGLLETYLQELRAGDVEGYDLTHATDDMRLGAFQGPLVTMLGAFVASRTERSEAMFAAMANRAAAQIIDHDALDLLA